MRTMTSPHRTRPVRALTLALTALLTITACGCARTPSGIGSVATGKQVIVTVNFAGAVNPNDYYFVFFNPVTVAGQTPGPIPVVASPWGNSIYTIPTAGAITAFMEFNQSFQGQTNNGYAMYAVNQASPLLYSPIPAPVQVFVLGASGTQLQFQIPLSEIPTTVTGATNLQVNFMATDNINMSQNPNNASTRNLGLLGTGNQWITVPTTQSQIITSAGTPTEPGGQVWSDQGTGGLVGNSNVPALQIQSWSIQIS